MSVLYTLLFFFAAVALGHGVDTILQRIGGRR